MKVRRKTLLDILCLRFPEKTREQHLACVLCGDIYAAGERVRDPRRSFPADVQIQFKTKTFVSRGGEKLEFALTAWNITAAGKIVLDAGSSAGGFTQCLLEHGARGVHAVDVGYNQIHPALRKYPRVFLQEETNIMSLSSLNPQPAFAVCDLSFRSLRGAARHILALTAEDRLIALVKPQFEWENPPADFDGVVRGEDALRSILLDLISALQTEKVYTRDIAESPITGRSGNREFLFDLNSKEGLGLGELKEKIEQMIHD
jgi:23S rRNA (cytidine1920-2'-O)/16S rRNA (cytidine1409-2'-O)-methyltransferase